MARPHRDGWQGDVVLEDGKRRRRQFKTQSEAEAWEKSFAAPPKPAEDRPTLLEYVKPRIDLIWERGSKHGDASFRKLQSLHERMNYPLEDIDNVKISALIQDLFEEEENTGGTVNRKLAAISKALRHAQKHGFFKGQFPDFPRQAEPRGKLRWLDYDEEERLCRELEKFNPQYPAFVRFMTDTGLRITNGVTLSWKDTTIKRKTNQRHTITFFHKGQEWLTLPLSVRAEQAIREQDHEARGPWTWVNQWTLRHHLDTAYKLAGIDKVTPHTFRHTCASRLVIKGMDLKRVQEFMGHKSFSMTLRYAHLRPSDLEKCAEALDQPHL